jgi:hypothetical protein
MPNEISLPSEFKEITTDNELFCQFDEENGVLLLDIKNPLTTEDFETISEIIDPYYEAHGELKGVIIHAKKFPYWTDPYNRSEYFSFAQNNHFKFQKAAMSMGGFFIKIVIRVARGRVHPQVKLFGYNKIEQAQHWILSS